MSARFKMLCRVVGSMSLFGFVSSLVWPEPLKHISRCATFPYTTSATSSDWFEPKVPVFSGVHVPLSNATDIPQYLVGQLNQYVENDPKTYALLVLRDGDVIFRFQRGEKKTNSNSMAKGVLSLLLGIAIDRGYFNLKTPIVQLFDDIALNPALTIEDLLRMQSGFNINETRVLGPLWNVMFSSNVRSALKNGLKVADSEPARAFSYLNVNYQLLGMVLEKVTGLKYAKILSDWLWIPLGNEYAELWPDDEGNVRTFCCVFASTDDWARIGEMMRNDGISKNGVHVVSKQWLDYMKRPSLDHGYGAGIWLGNNKGTFKKDKREIIEPFEDLNTFFLDGAGKQRVYVVPSVSSVIVRTGENSDAWDDSFLPNIVRRELLD